MVRKGGLRSLVRLNISHNEIGEEGMRALGQVAREGKLPKLEWQPPEPQHIPQHGSIDSLSVVEWSNAAAPPSKVEFALGPPVLRPSEPEPEGEAPAG